MKNYLKIVVPLLILIFPGKSYSQDFSDTGITLYGTGQGSVAWGDYDNNGFADILTSGLSETDPATVIYKNNGNNTFTVQTTITLPGVFISSVQWADFDNDGTLIF
jgi:hypothetical protein